MQGQRIGEPADPDTRQHKARLPRRAQSIGLDQRADEGGAAIEGEGLKEHRAKTEPRFRIGEDAAIARDGVGKADVPDGPLFVMQQQGGADGRGEGEGGGEIEKAAPAQRHGHDASQARAQDHAGQASGQKSPDGELADVRGIFVANRRHGHRHDAASGDAAQQAEAQQNFEGGGEDAADRAEGQKPEAGLQHPRLAVEVADGAKHRLAQRIGEGIDRGQKGGRGDGYGEIPRDQGQQRVHGSIGQRARKAADDENEEYHGPV